jgi:hypothetical protein
VEAGLQTGIQEKVPAATESGSTHDGTAADVDAQLSALLESVQADRAHVPPATERSDSAAAGATTRPDGVKKTHALRRRKRAPKRERVRRERRTDARARADGGLAPKPEPARIHSVRDPAARETAYYVIAVFVLAVAASFLCTRLLT